MVSVRNTQSPLESGYFLLYGLLDFFKVHRYIAKLLQSPEILVRWDWTRAFLSVTTGLCL